MILQDILSLIALLFCIVDFVLLVYVYIKVWRKHD